MWATSATIPIKLSKISRTWTSGTITWDNFTASNSTNGTVFTGDATAANGAWDKFNVTSAVLGWLNTPTTNNGLMIEVNTLGDIGRGWVSQGGTAANRPILRIEYSTTATVPVRSSRNTLSRLYQSAAGLEYQVGVGQPHTLAIFSATGKQLLIRAINGSGIVSTDNLSAGAYVARLKGTSVESTVRFTVR